MRDPHRLSGVRDVRTSLDGGSETAVVVVCPPHPQFGGDRHDSRLQAVSATLLESETDCLRLDYGTWDEGRGERTDVLTALEWAHESYDRVGLFGYSFGVAVALAAAIETAPENEPAAVSVLAPAVGSVDEFDPAELERLTAPTQVVYGECDETADWQTVIKRAESLGWTVESLPADHFFLSQQGEAAELIGSFFQTRL